MKKADSIHHSPSINEGLLDSLLSFVQSAGNDWIKASKVDIGKLKQPPSESSPGTIGMQVDQVSSTLQIVGYSVDVINRNMDTALSELSDGPDPGEEGYVDHITGVLGEINSITGEAAGWLIQGAGQNETLAPPVQKIAAALEPKKSIAENASQLKDAYQKIRSLDLKNQAAQIINSEQGEQYLMGPGKWAKQYIDEGLKFLGDIDNAEDRLGQAADAAEEVQQLLDEMAQQPDAVDSTDEVSSNVFKTEALHHYVRKIIAEEIRNGS